jgi:hypothetical protein
MSIKLAKNFLIDSSLNLYAGFYQQLIGDISNFQELGDRVVKIAEQAQAFRQNNRLREAAQLLINMPIRQYQAIGYYYFGLFEYRSGKNPKEIFERVAEEAPTAYRLRAMHSLATVEARQQRHESELFWLIESLKIAPSAESLRGMAIVKAKENYHQSAVKDLENLYPFMRHVNPITYYQYLNSLAVELGAVGRKYEARNVIKHVLASPFAMAYPEWRETAEELKEANRSFAIIPPLPLRPRNVLSMPALERDGAEFPAWAGQPAPVVSYQKWKQRMANKKNSEMQIEQMTEADMFNGIIDVYTSDDTTDELRRKIYDAVMKAISEADRPDMPDIPDDDTPGA